MSGVYNIVIEQNSAFSRVFTSKDASGNPVNLTGATASLVARSKEGGTPVLNLTQSSGLVLGGSAGTISVTLTDTATKAFTFSGAKYTLKVNDTILLHGNIVVIPEYSA